MNIHELRRCIEKLAEPLTDEYWTELVGHLEIDNPNNYDLSDDDSCEYLIESAVNLIKLSAAYNPRSNQKSVKRRYGGRSGTGWTYQKSMQNQHRLTLDVELIREFQNTNNWSIITRVYNNAYGTNKRRDTLEREYRRAKRNLEGYDASAENIKVLKRYLSNWQTQFEKRYKHPAARVFEMSCIISKLKQKTPTDINNAFLNLCNLLYGRYERELTALALERYASKNSHEETEISESE